MRFLENSSFDFVNIRKPFYIFSAVLVLIVVSSILIKGFNLSIDFKEGTEVVLRFKEPINVQDFRKAMANENINGQVRSYGDQNEIIIKTEFINDLSSFEESLSALIEKNYPNNSFQVMRMDKVGPTIARDLTRSAIYALLAALVMILIYVAFRFELKFAIASIIATLHDIIMVSGVFSLFGGMFEFMPLEFDQSIIAALLTVAGYSITDTVVVYDRIRENLKSIKTSSNIINIFNVSLNQTLSRTVITSITTLFSVVVLFIFAGPIIRSFAFAVGLGIFFGTYSSLFIASMIALDMQLKSKKTFKLK